ncbi:MAG: serine--tRNA ligase [Firmicutes bacterium]|nr:serine--tRNA ligase [Bacillota bacterium]
MLDLKFIRENAELVKKSMQRRGTEDRAVDQVLTLDEKRRELLGSVEELKRLRNQVSQQVASLKRQGNSAEAEIASMQSVNERIRNLDEQLSLVQNDMEELLLTIPNVPHETIPDGCTEADNQLVKTWGEPNSQPRAKAHWDFEELDFESAGKITGSRFCFYRGMAAKLERALINLMLDTHGQGGYEEVIPPFMVNADSMRGTGQLPKFAEDSFSVNYKDYYLIPTAEVPLTNYYRDCTLKEVELPIKFVAYSPCFRSEAGAHGRDTRGLIRNHQFNKVELVKFSHPGQSYQELEKMLGDAERILQLLELPYRVVTLCAGDLGFSAAKTYDIEVWLPSQNCYREISSVSNFEDFQARRANIRYRPEAGGKSRYVHTLNGSGLAVGRALAAVLENHQKDDGSVILPAALARYMGAEKNF